MKLVPIVHRYRGRLEQKHGHELLPGHYRALEAILDCGTEECGQVVFDCPDCHHEETHPCSCGHRFCPVCRNFDTTRWIERQCIKLLPVNYYMVTVTLPGVLRPLAWCHQKQVYSDMFTAAVDAMREIAHGKYGFDADIAMTGVLHTHARNRNYHPHIHFIVPGGGIDRKKKVWRKRTGKWLFPEKALSRLFRGKLRARLLEAGLCVPATVYRHDTVVRIISVGSGAPALKYMARYLYRGVLPEKAIIADNGEDVTFEYVDNKKKRHTRTLPGEDFLWLLLRHVLPKNFMRSRDYGFLHHNAKKTLRLVQYVLHARVDTTVPAKRPARQCSCCQTPMVAVAFILPACYRLTARDPPP